MSGDLQYKKLCCRRVPELLSEENKNKRLASAVTFLSLHNEEGDDSLSRIVTGDETWVSPLLRSEDLPARQALRQRLLISGYYHRR
ncbi:hypothetical protein AVEN_216460-1 [Araneus ventricosus]|uniref:Uncharacterized protein n=1 Tax=Araneus ventricosus TaxID=182803 RepID=A0A4Y2BN38_ARAVE|nr:hypothetical protein AVEN_216460-1 [Araneus ventricosus]